MTDNFKAVYRILSSLEEQLDKEHIDTNKFSYEQLGITEIRWLNYLEMMQDVGYIKGCKIQKIFMMNTYMMYLTLKSL